MYMNNMGGQRMLKNLETQIIIELKQRYLMSKDIIYHSKDHIYSTHQYTCNCQEDLFLSPLTTEVGDDYVT